MGEIGLFGKCVLKDLRVETSLMVQWLRLHAPNARGPVWIPGQGTRFLMLQLSSHSPTKDPTCCNQDPVQPKKNKDRCSYSNKH